jgi:hypothetical protein
MVKKRTRSASSGATALEREKFFARVDPTDADTFRAVRAVLVEAERRRVTDAEVFRLAVRGLVASLPDAQRKRLERARG